MPVPNDASPDNTPSSPNGVGLEGGPEHRVRREPLTRERMLTAALRLVDAEGLPALTMRRLGRELGRDPMALYRYAPNRAALLDGVTELVLSQLAIPVSGGDWPAQLRRTAHDFRQLALTHPHVVPPLVTRPLSTPLGLRPLGTLRPLEQLLALLIEAGCTPVDALHVYRAYFGFCTATSSPSSKSSSPTPKRQTTCSAWARTCFPPESSPGSEASPPPSHPSTAPPNSIGDSTSSSPVCKPNSTPQSADTTGPDTRNAKIDAPYAGRPEFADTVKKAKKSPPAGQHPRSALPPSAAVTFSARWRGSRPQR